MNSSENTSNLINTIDALARCADYSLMNTLRCDPDAREDAMDHSPREVFSGHYVPVKPTPLEEVEYITHSKVFFKELGFDDSLAQDAAFMAMFSGDLSQLPAPLKKHGWATGYALSIYGTEYYQQCPFGTGNGYGDGRAISIFEGVLNKQRWEMQLKGGGTTPYCRGADGRAVLRSSIREFLAQEHMHALGIPSSRSLSLYTSKTQRVSRPWFREHSYSKDPEVMISEPIAISTRVAPSFLRVGQIELFGRRARKREHPQALEELEMIVNHLITREYSTEIDTDLGMVEKVLALANAFRTRLTSLVTQWIRVGYCQGNFNSDNCAAGGYTLDFGPFGFCDDYNPKYQPWTGGGEHFAFLNQPQAAKKNFQVFCIALLPLVEEDTKARETLETLINGFDSLMQEKMSYMWADKLGLERFDAALFQELHLLMQQSKVDYTLFFRELSHIPANIEPLKKSFYHENTPETLLVRWSDWLEQWQSLIKSSKRSIEEISTQMKTVNPKYTLREFFLVPAYQSADDGDYTLTKELQSIMTKPYEEQSKTIETKYYTRKPSALFDVAGVSHVSCSS